jgi:hypothetical protein
MAFAGPDRAGGRAWPERAWSWLSARPVLICLLLAAVAALSMVRQWGGTVYWDADALYYQAQTFELRGQDVTRARLELFSGPLAARARRLDVADAGQPRRVTDPAWVDYSARWYRRRWLLPLAAAGVYPVLGLHSLQTLSLLGYVALGPLLFLLLRRRFSASTSVVVTLGCLALPPLRDWAIYPLTDTWGLALEIAGLLLAVAVLERGARWLLPWALCIVALAFTRDTAFVLLVAAALVAVRLRTRLAVTLAATGAVAALPAPLLFQTAVRDQLAYVLEDRTIPSDTSWSFVAHHYLPTVGRMADDYATYVSGHVLVVAAFAVGLALLYLLRDRRDPLLLMLAWLPVGYLTLLALGPTYSAFRYELVLIPSVAAGLALGVERAAWPLARSIAIPHKPVAARSVDQS